jgi:acetoin:2,6-dichlorophenolindophenol oxidoreductase subunit alpha
VIYVCENNSYCEYTHFSETTAGSIAGRPAAFGVHCEEVDGQDVWTVYQAAARAAERARAGDGPTFLVCNTYRYHGHHVGDVAREYYRSKEEEQEWSTRRDPLLIAMQRMREQATSDSPTLDAIQREVQEQMEQAVRFALDAPYPSADQVQEDVYAD